MLTWFLYLIFVAINDFDIIVVPLHIRSDDNIFYENESTSFQILRTTCSLESRFMNTVSLFTVFFTQNRYNFYKKISYFGA